jgi:dienelactone hydrolase
MRAVHLRRFGLFAGGQRLEAELAMPDGATGLAVLAWSDGCALEPGHRHVAGVLHEENVATLLVELLTPTEAGAAPWMGDTGQDVGLLAQRLEAACEWARGNAETQWLPLGYFGVGAAGAAVLVAAVHAPQGLRAVVCRGAPVDRVGEAVERVRVPTLLIVAGNDTDRLEENARALARLPGEKSLRLVPGASAAFTEPGAEEDAARLARDWLARHFREATEMAPGWRDEEGRWV